MGAAQNISTDFLTSSFCEDRTVSGNRNSTVNGTY